MELSMTASEIQDELNHTQEMLDAYRQRKQVLELKKATFGLALPTHEAVELKNLIKDIAASERQDKILKAKLATLQERGGDKESDGISDGEDAGRVSQPWWRKYKKRIVGGLGIIVLSVVAIVLIVQGTSPADFSGTWDTNIAFLRVDQRDAEVFVTVQGYGGGWDFFVKGTVKGRVVYFNGDGVLELNSIEISEDGNSFKSTDPNIGFCGVRSGALPVGCGFSGTWILSGGSSLDLPEGSHAVLIQNGSKVRGPIYDQFDVVIDNITGDVDWGKGWHMTGRGKYLPEFFWNITTDEQEFEWFMGEVEITGTRDDTWVRGQ
jgi:hypothetical protein